MLPSTISAINRLPEPEKRQIYTRIVPDDFLERFGLSCAQLQDPNDPHLVLNAPPGSSVADLSIYHKPGFPDPLLYGQIADSLNGQFHILLYVLNDPEAPRFDVDRMPNGTPTQFGILHRNLQAEQEAMQAGLAPGQVRRGLRGLKPAVHAFEKFVADAGHNLHFAEPLFYHNAVIFERYGFAYSKGRKLMERIQAGFAPGGDLLARLDGSSPFRRPEAAESIRLRSWAIHDGILGQPFTDVTMYKQVGKMAGLSTCSDCRW